MKMTDIVISINVYKSMATFERQLQTIRENVLCHYYIVYNCNDYMYKELTAMKLPENVYINPEVIDKSFPKVPNGRLTKGIVSNMRYATENFSFRHIIILSGRTVFYRKMALDDLNRLTRRWSSMEERKASQIQPFENRDWIWPRFRNTQLAKYYLERGYRLEGSAHEGLCFSENVVRNIVKFLHAHPDIYEDLCNFHAGVEEFSLQTIASNEVDEENMEYGFSYIGHGVKEVCDVTMKDRYTCKILFL